MLVGSLALGLLVGLALRSLGARRPAAHDLAGARAGARELRRLAASSRARRASKASPARSSTRSASSSPSASLLLPSSRRTRVRHGLPRPRERQGRGLVAGHPLDLVREPSGSRARRTRHRASPSTTSAASTRVSPRLAAEVARKALRSCRSISDDRVIAVISVATTDDYRAFSAEDLAVMQTSPTRRRSRSSGRARRSRSTRRSPGSAWSRRSGAGSARSSTSTPRRTAAVEEVGTCSRGCTLLRPPRRRLGRASGGRRVDARGPALR